MGYLEPSKGNSRANGFAGVGVSIVLASYCSSTKPAMVLAQSSFPFWQHFNSRANSPLLLVAEYLTPMCLGLITVLWNGITELGTNRGRNDGIYDHGGNGVSIEKA